MKRKFYGYGIVGKSGAPWWDDGASVSHDHEAIAMRVNALNGKWLGFTMRRSNPRTH